MSEPDKKEAESKSPKKNISSRKKKPRQIGLNELSKIKGGILPKGTAYSTTSLRDKIVKRISWHESEWPELPKLDPSSSQTEAKSREKGPSPSTSSVQCTILEEGEERQDKDGLNEENIGEIVCLKVQFKCNHIHSAPKILYDNCQDCTEREQTSHCTSNSLEAVTCNFSALNVSNDYQQLCHDQTQVKEHTQQSHTSMELSSFENQNTIQVQKSASLQRQLSAKKKIKEDCSKHETQKSTCSSEDNDKVILQEDDFPDLLCNSRTRKEIKLCLLPKEDPCIPVKKLVKKYPRKNDPICINLSEVLENLSGNPKDCKIMMRSKYFNEIRSATARTAASRRVIKRGKQREFPKRKILSKLKLAILRGRHQRHQTKLLNCAKSFNYCENANDLRFVENFKTLPSATQSGEFDPRKDSPEVSCENVEEEHCLDEFSDSPVCFSSLEKRTDLADNTVLSVAKEKTRGGGIQVKLGQLMRQYVNSSPLTSEVVLAAKSSIHSRKFREYCSNDTSVLLEDKVKAFVKQIYRYQTKSHFRDAEKARIHRRYALGLREADKFLKLRKLKVLIIATDLEVSFEKGGLDETIENIKVRASKENLPVIFSLKRRDLAYCVFRKVPVSCMAVLNFEGAEESYRAMIEAWREASMSYDRRLKEKIESLSHQVQLNECCNDSPLASTCTLALSKPGHHEERGKAINSTDTPDDQAQH